MNATPKRKPHGGGFLLFRPDGKQTSTGKAGNRAMITRARESQNATPFVALDTTARKAHHERAAATSAARVRSLNLHGKPAASLRFLFAYPFRYGRQGAGGACPLVSCSQSSNPSLAALHAFRSAGGHYSQTRKG